jgi:hypothetical protein
MADDRQPRTIQELVLPILVRPDGTAIDPWDSLALSYILDRGRWHDDTPVDPWKREALRLLLDERAPLDQQVPPPVGAGWTRPPDLTAGPIAERALADPAA